MTDAILEVIKDLWHFVFDVSESPETYGSKRSKLPAAIKSKVSAPILSDSQMGQTAYVCVDRVVCYSQPEILLDARIGEFCYGDKVIVLRLTETYAEVKIRKTRGWMTIDSLTEDKSKVFPILKSSYVHGHQNEETEKLRKFIQDEALGGKLNLPLQPIELILFLLKTNHIKVNWPEMRPRVIGLWNVILRGIKGVSMSIEPHTNSVIEYAGTESQGFVGYVEAVHPDMSITMRSVGRLQKGEYRVEEFTHDQWKEWRPVFISFS